MMRYYKGVAQYQILKRDQRRWKSKVYVLVGEPELGRVNGRWITFLMPIGNRGVIGGMGIIMMK